MLQYTLRVRDLVHGTILFTEQEKRIIDHPYFQRLRQVRHNDVAFYVYPSLNTSRFEHVLGTCRVAGMMAENLTKSPKWNVYLKELKAHTGIATKEQFIELVRLYALLHDIGHLPLSHLFEMAVRNWAGEQKAEKVVEEWAGAPGFEKLHEAYGGAIAKQILANLKLPKATQHAIGRLMTEEIIHPVDPLSIIKLLVSDNIEADRIDFVQRDGLLAGSEYGNYDIRRLCDSVFVERDANKWLLAYSEKALTSMEALLLDRYRTHVWIHFHHRVVAMKTLVSFLIGKALEQQLIRKEHFNIGDADAFALKDDVWLWGVLRGIDDDRDPILQRIKRAVFYREKRDVLNLWKTRLGYHALYDRVKEKASVTSVKLGKPEFYLAYLGRQMRVQALLFKPPFKPIGEKALLLYSEEKKELTGKNLLGVSRLVANLEALWKDEPQEFIVLVGKNTKARAKQLQERWVKLTVDWIQAPRMV